MNNSFQKGTKVRWNSEVGEVSGTIIKILTRKLEAWVQKDPQGL